MAEEEGGGGSMSDVLFIVLVIVVIVASWFLSGAARDADVRSIFLAPPGPSTTGTEASIGAPSVDFSQDSREDSERITDEIGSVRRELESIKALPTSPYVGQIELYSDSQGDGTAGKEYLLLRSRDTNTQKISISNWSVMSAITKRTSYVRLGTTLYEPLNTSTLGPIELNPGDEAVVISGRSPVGVSMRLNACSGYLDQFQAYTPQLPQTCPYPDIELQSAPSSVQNDNACVNYIERMGQCRIDTAPPSTLSENCRAFIGARLTYQGCVTAHRGDGSFASRRWYVYLGQTEPQWRDEREVLVLLDQNGKVVDTFSY